MPGDDPSETATGALRNALTWVERRRRTHDARTPKPSGAGEPPPIEAGALTQEQAATG